MASKRILKELKDLQKDLPTVLHPTVSVLENKCFIGERQSGSPFGGGVFLVSIHFPPDYTFKPPKGTISLEKGLPK